MATEVAECEHMIITRTPTRISFLGGGSDYKVFSDVHGGLCVGGAISHYSYLTARYYPPFHEHKSRVVYSKIENVAQNNDIEHRAVHAVLGHLDMMEVGVEITHTSDLPARTGTGSSSAFIVGLLNALSALKGKVLLPQQLAKQAIHIEQDVMGETVGCQDQVFAANGGLRALRFHPDGKIGVYPLALDGAAVKELESWLMLYYTGLTRTASDVAQTYVADLPKKHARTQWAQLALAEQAVMAVEARDWETLGRLMDKGWELKRSLSPSVSNTAIDHYYADARLAGAVGGKLLGAGGGGCLCLVCEPTKQWAVAGAMQSLVRVPFSFDFGGSRIIHCDIEGR